VIMRESGRELAEDTALADTGSTTLLFLFICERENLGALSATLISVGGAPSASGGKEGDVGGEAGRVDDKSAQRPPTAGRLGGLAPPARLPLRGGSCMRGMVADGLDGRTYAAVG
jgi:hypothetical protein